ncbi:MAG: leucyl aminopeptidase family protein [Planctomycetota bacterium]
MFDSISVRSRGAASTLVIGYLKGKPLSPEAKELDADGSIAAALKRGEATGEPGSVAQVFPAGGDPAKRVLLVGLGDAKDLDVATLRTMAGHAGRQLAAAKESSVRFELSGPLMAARLDVAEAYIALGEGLGLIGWTCDDFRGEARPPRKRTKLAITEPVALRARALKHGLGLAEGANLARTLSQTPPNIATPLWMAQQAGKLKKHGVAVRVLKGATLEREGLEGLINVGKASENEPCLIRMEYKPPPARKGAKPIVLVGKTMTYDTGGLSLKINNSMRGMKRDKDGGCAVLGAMHAIATTIKPKVPVVALLCAAENSISDEAYRPDDVLTFRNGVTVEVTNTDAEGRLVLADGLCWACDKEKPAAILDIATLTGGVVVALGSTFAGVWCEDEKLLGRVQDSADATGERVWRLPMHREYRDMMKSSVADIINSNPNRKAHPIQGAAFLSYFVDEKVPWCHIDIAGTHAVDADEGPYIAGPTGFGARLLARLAEHW